MYPGIKAAPSVKDHPAQVLHGTARGLDVYVLDAEHLYYRDGGPYAAPDGMWRAIIAELNRLAEVDSGS